MTESKHYVTHYTCIMKNDRLSKFLKFLIIIIRCLYYKRTKPFLTLRNEPFKTNWAKMSLSQNGKICTGGSDSVQVSTPPPSLPPVNNMTHSYSYSSLHQHRQQRLLLSCRAERDQSVRWSRKKHQKSSQPFSMKVFALRSNSSNRSPPRQLDSIEAGEYLWLPDNIDPHTHETQSAQRITAKLKS